jgi:hypothetical protein
VQQPTSIAGHATGAPHDALFTAQAALRRERDAAWAEAEALREELAGMALERDDLATKVGKAGWPHSMGTSRICIAKCAGQCAY